jgi:hypothetical protein
MGNIEGRISIPVGSVMVGLQHSNFEKPLHFDFTDQNESYSCHSQTESYDDTKTLQLPWRAFPEKSGPCHRAKLPFDS